MTSNKNTVYYDTAEAAESARMRLGVQRSEFYLVHESGAGWSLKDKRLRVSFEKSFRTPELKDLIRPVFPVSTL